MYCSRCGRETDDTGAICQHCGAPIQGTGYTTGGYPTVAPPAPGNPVYGAPNGGNGQRPMGEYQARVHQTIRNQGKSVFFLICAVLYTLAVVFQLFEANVNTASLSSILEKMDLPSGMRGDINSVASTGSLMSAVISALPQLLTVLALWLIYGGSYAREGHGPAGGGLVLLKVLEIIRIVIISLALLLILISMMVSCSAVADYRIDGIMALILLVFGLVIGMLVLMLISSAKALGIYNVVRNSMKTGTPDSNLSGFVAVMTIVFASLGVLSMAFAFSWSSLLLCVAQILLAVQIYLYRNAMRELENESHLYMSSYIGAYKTNGYVPTWKRMAAENGFGSDDNQ